MASCPQLQIDRAFLMQRSSETPADPLFKRGFDLGYTLGEDAGFDRGWSAAKWDFRPWWLKLWHYWRGTREPSVRRFMDEQQWHNYWLPMLEPTRKT